MKSAFEIRGAGVSITFELAPASWDVLRGNVDASITVVTNWLTASGGSRLYSGDLLELQEGLERIHRRMSGRATCIFQNSLSIRAEFVDDLGHVRWIVAFGNPDMLPSIRVEFDSDQAGVGAVIAELEHALRTLVQPPPPGSHR